MRASCLSTNTDFNEYLRLQAQALLVADPMLDAYADKKWALLQDTPLEFTITRENYSDSMTETVLENDELNKLLKENNNVQFLIFGEGASKDKINKKIQELNLKNIKVEGKIDYCNVYTILKYSKISFISLKNNKMTDSVPTKIYDALACGCPILLLAKGDSCKILDEVGLGEHVESKEELKDKFEYMYKNYIKYENKKDDVIEYTKEKYSRRKIAEKFEREAL